MSPITLITDFGTRDHYVGAIKGVILGIAPGATIVDITHDVEPHNIVQAAFVLRRTIEWFPSGTVHLAVVDPGVGSKRRILAGRYAGQVVIAPDNGLISLVHRDLTLEALHTVENPRYFHKAVSDTFHGRDILAPVAAHVASGVSLAQLGPPASGIDLLQSAAPERIDPAGLRGAVVFIDRFGNLVTNISVEDLASVFGQGGDVKVYVGETCIGPIHRTYSDVSVGQPVALMGSSKLLEISVNRGRADDQLAAAPETPVYVR